MKNIKTNIITLLIILYSGGNCFSQQLNKEDMENKFFTLDFESQSYKMSDVEEYFFTTFPHDDPTQGDIVYDRVKWVNNEMVKLTDLEGFYGYIKYRSDSASFDSFRFTSKPFYNLNDEVKKVLFVFKGRLPSAKGVWPAWWLNGSREKEWTYSEKDFVLTDNDLDRYSGVGQFYNTPSAVNCTDWPAAGEVDIIETINGDNIIHNTIHTCPQMCNSEWNNDGIIINCANATKTDPNSGCSGKSYEVDSPEGTFACLWMNDEIRFYYWKPGLDVRSEGGPLSNSPQPEMWAESNMVNYVKLFDSHENCDDEIHKDWQCESCSGFNKCSFVNLKMIFNITLCGIWAGRNFDDTENAVDNCQKYIVSEGLSAIDNQYIKIEYVSVKRLE